MKKSKVTALILAMVMAISLFTIPASAAESGAANRLVFSWEAVKNLSSADALAILKHVVGVEPLSEERKEKLKISESRAITTADALSVLKSVVGQYDMTIDKGADIDTKTIIPTSSYITTDSFNDDYVKMNIDNNVLNVNFKTIMNKDDWSFNIKSTSNSNGKKETGTLDSNGSFTLNVDLNDLRNGNYTVNFYLKKSNERTYWSTLWNVPLIVQDGNASFVESSMLEHNQKAREIGLQRPPNEYLNVNLGESEKEELKNLITSIIGNETDDFKKIKLINDWVVENIYYDDDGLTAGKVDATAYGTYKNKRSVCAGYTNLMNELVRLAGIPCRVASGQAIAGSGEDVWDKIDHTVTDHAWNEAYVNGRWIIIDTTWNTSNKFKGGKFIKGNIKYTYFDPTIEAFSRTHKYLSYN